jgi:hypothetical protein
MDVSEKTRNDLREEISVLRGLIDDVLDRAEPIDERLLRVYADTLHRREELLEDLEQAEDEA